MAGSEESGGSGHPFHPFDVNAPHLAYAFLGGFVVLFSLCSLFIKERLYIGEAVVSTVVGIILGPFALGLFNPGSWGGRNHNSEVTDEITLEVTRVVIAVGVFAIGVELPKKYVKHHWKSLAFLLGPVMAWGWLVTALFIWAMIPHLQFLTSLAIAACVTPTDPILAQAVVGGKFAAKHVPTHIRHLLSAESGCNDGAAFPFLFLALYLILETDDGYAVGEWFYVTWLYEVALGIVIGSILGFVARKAIKFSEKRGYIDRQSFVAQYISLALLTIGILTLLGSDDLLGAFFCGTAFAWDGFFNKATEDSMFSNVLDLLFNCACFIYIGAIIPFSEFQDIHTSITVWRLFVLIILVLLFRRLPVMLALYRWIPDIKTLREAAFVGWFGPMGVGAIFIATLAKLDLPLAARETEDPQSQTELLAATIQPIVAFMVLCSVVCHGLSIPFFSLTRRVHSMTHTWSRQSFGDEPAWATHARRLRPGESIRVNRDDDLDIADDGVTDRGEAMVLSSEKRLSRSQSNSLGSQTAVSSSPEQGEQCQTGGGERADIEAMENGTYQPNPETRSEAQENEEDYVPEDEDYGRTTPVLAEYREGNHLVRERKNDDSDSVEVEVIQHYFDRHEPSQSTKFRHPQPLKRHEVDILHSQLEHSPEHAADFVRDGGRDRVDRLGLGLMGTEPTPATEREERERQLDNGKRERVLDNGENEGEVQRENTRDLERYDSNALNRSDSRSTEGPADREDSNEHTLRRANTRGDSNNEEYELGRVSSRVSAIFGGGRKKGRQSSISQRFLGGIGKKTDSEDVVRPRDIEEGRAAGNVPDESPAPAPETSRPIFNSASNPRSNSPSRHLSLRFAPDTAESSETAPGPASYKRPAPNPSLSMYRSTSLQPGSQEREEEEAPKGNQYYKRGNANPALSMFRAQTVQVDKNTDEGGGRHIAFDLPERKPKKKRW